MPGIQKEQQTGASLQLVGSTARCAGTWTVLNLEPVETAAAGMSWPASGVIEFDVSGVTRMDTAGAWLLARTVRGLEAAGRTVSLHGVPAHAEPLLALVGERPPAPQGEPFRAPGFFEQVGRNTVGHLRQNLGFLAFIGELALAAGAQLRRPLRIRWRALLHELEAAGCNALPIVGLLSFLLGVVIAYQGGVQLRYYGANIYIVDLVGLSMLRELAPLITAIIVAGRTGSAFAAEIGTMQVTEEVDALRTMGIYPMELLVLPKLLALIVALPLLTVYADVLGVAGGMVMSGSLLGVPAAAFLDRFPEAVGLKSYLIGIGKAPVFAAVIAAVGCYQGFRVQASAESVGRQTTVSVVQAIFLVIVVDAAFSVVFSWLGI